ncbi:deoxyribonuclease II [Necator americanus]|uniref:Deoxyribonuclease II n=1 Tax=Necator americanus TaxID=51031 RepID=W2TRS4_NECAM|nr:deoxyribonuclease II [Necator americanus]ETN83806.1 deoxyribonuclease II [Necator americanus]
MSTEPVDSVKSAIGATVNQLYNIDKRNTFTIAYNDDSPVAKAESGRGHSKGVAVFNGEIGFWLIHSVPNFPPINLWHDFIAPNLKTSMAVETWRSGGANDVGSQCGMKLDVYDISNVTVLGKSFANSQDHSKWGASMNSEVPAVCIGDVNRQVSQFKRGGGAVCIEDEKLWMTFYHSVAGYEDCAVPGN